MHNSASYFMQDKSEDQFHKEICDALRLGLADKLRNILEEFPGSPIEHTVLKHDENLTCLHEAVHRQLFQCVKVLVEVAHVDVNAKTLHGLTPLHFAAKHGKEDVAESDKCVTDKELVGVLPPEVDDPMIAYLVQHGARVNERDQNGLTPLHYAAGRGRVMAAKQLLREGAIVECTDYEEMTPLLIAVKNQHRSLVELLLDYDADYMRMDKWHNNVLHHACHSGNQPLVEQLMLKDGVIDLLNEGNRKNETPLHLAVLSQDAAVCEYLLDKGASVHVKTTGGETVLHYAAPESNLMITRLLISRGAHVDEVDDQCQTPLFKAIRGGQLAVVRVLLNEGASVNHIDSASQTPLILAAKLGKVDICDELLNNGADCFRQDSYHNNALFCAIMNKHHAVVERLILTDRGFELLQTKDDSENSPLHVAVRTGSLKTADLLLNSDTSLWSVNSSEHTPLHVAAMHGRYGIMLRILNLYPNAATKADEDGNLPVHLAARHGYPQVLRKLLEHSSLVNDKNGYGWTPLMHAAANNQIDCVKFLLREGAKVNPKDKSNFTPLFVACQRGYSEVVRELLQYGALPQIRVIDTHALYPGWNCLDIAIHENRVDCVRQIIQSDHWEVALHNLVTDDLGTRLNPLRRMIIEMPEAADFVMARCVHDDCLPMNALDHTITFEFRYLNDASMFSSTGLCGQEKATAKRNLTELSKMDFDQAAELTVKTREKKSKETCCARPCCTCRRQRLKSPIELMIEHGRDELLHHPLVIALLSYKWARLNLLYYIHLLAYTLFLAIFTSFMLLTDPPYLFKNETMTNMKEICMILDNANEKAYRHNILFPKYGTIVFSAINLIVQILQFARDGLSYLNVENLLEVVIYVLTLLTTVDSNMCMMRTGLREDWQWNCGTLGLFLAWNNLLLFVRRGPIFGIFVIMFVSVSLTFVKFICVFSPFLIAFALSFHALLTNQNAFKNMQNSLIKTFVMTIGEVDLGDHLFERYSSEEPDKQVHYEFITYLLFIVFLALMCIVMMNLLVGLAVDDIKGVQRKATLKRQEMRVEMLLAMESTLSRFGQLTTMPARYDYRPNRCETNVDLVFHQAYCNYEKATKDLDVKPEDESVDFAEIEKAVKSIRVQNLEIAKLLNKVVDRLNVDSGTFRRTSAFRSKRSARNAPMGVASTSDMPQMDLSAEGAIEEGPEFPSNLPQAPAPTIERLNVDEDYDQEPVLFSA